jgi:outer membrane protein assembly factor BamB
VGSYLYSWQTEKAITSKPLMNEKLMAFASQDGKVYLASLKDRKIIHRVMTKGPIRGNMGLYGVQQLLVGSDDHKIYSIDLFEPENEATNWVFPTSAPLDHAVVVAGDDAYTVTKDGILYAINAKQGTEKWQLQIGKAKLLAITPTKIYGVTVDGAMAVVNRADGTVAVTPEQSYHSFGVDLKNYSARLANDRNDRIYLASDDGLLLCLRELGQVTPTPLRDPKLPKFGTTPQEIYEMNEPQEAPKKAEINAAEEDAAPEKADATAPKEN